jgi:hypothetical protein
MVSILLMDSERYLPSGFGRKHLPVPLTRCDECPQPSYRDCQSEKILLGREYTIKPNEPTLKT